MEKKKEEKVFNDPIHGTIALHPMCVKILDTPQFQRLRFIKQMGGTYFVYPGAAHNRFEHSIGTCHLAGMMIRALKSREPDNLPEDEKITQIDALCVQIAALCHDLGHGPFSHIFDKKVIPELQRREEEKTGIKKGEKWKHENASIKMFRYILEINDNLMSELEEYHIKDDDLTFIEEMIVAPKSADDSTDGKDVWSYKGRSKKKAFLYEIVSNKFNGIDVDKWDYFARDYYMLGFGNNFNHNRCIHFSRVIEVEGRRQICYRDKEVNNLYDMYHTRYLLHKRACQHKVISIIEIMLAEALVEANDFIGLPGKDGKPCTILEAIDDMEAYSVLTDDVIFQILRSTDENLASSKKLIKRIMSRELHTFIGEFFVHEENGCNRFNNKTEVINEIEKLLSEEDPRDLEDLKKAIVIDIVNFDYGKQAENPIDEVNFYTKHDPTKAEKIQAERVSLLLPKQFAEQLVRIYCKCPKLKKKMNDVVEKLAERYKKSGESIPRKKSKL